MKAALSPEEWATGTDMDFDYALKHRHRHGIAARLLYGQPFGFTHRDVRLIRDAAARSDYPEQFKALHLDLADRIEALLPPEG